MTYVIKTDSRLTDRVHSEEQIIGKRADFHVYHTTLGKRPLKRFDAVYAASADAAVSQTTKHYRNKVEVLFVVPMNKNVAVR